MTKVYAWPPVAHVAAEWTVHAPVSISRSLLTGASYVSAAQRVRRVARLDVSSLSLLRNGAGYMELLKRLLNGGVDLVRLYSTPINWHLDDFSENAARPNALSWIIPRQEFDWDGSAGEIQWYSSDTLQATVDTDGGVIVQGVAPSSMIVRPGEFVTLNGETAMVLRPAYSDASGIVTIYTLTPLSGSGQITIGSRETGVFAADQMPRALQPLGSNWTYSWSFTEVFEDERGPFEEVDPWT